MVELGTRWTFQPGGRLSIMEQPKWSLLGTTSSNQRHMRSKRQLRQQASTIHLQRVSKYVPLLHLYHKITRASSPGNEVLDQGGPLVFSVLKGAVIPNPEVLP